MKRLIVLLAIAFGLANVGFAQEDDDFELGEKMEVREKIELRQNKTESPTKEEDVKGKFEFKRKTKPPKDDNYQTLISRDRRITHGVYAGFETSYADIANRSGLLSGFNLAWVIDHTIEIGVVAKGFITNPLRDKNLDNREFLYAGGYGGLHFAGTVMGHKPINICFPLTVGGGGVSYFESYYNNSYDTYPYNSFLFFIAEPGIDIQFNVTRYFRVSAGVSYRYTSNLYLLETYDADLLVKDPGALRGFNYGVKLKFGWF